MVAERSRNHRVVHNCQNPRVSFWTNRGRDCSLTWLIGLALEVRVPAGCEVRRGPLLELLELLLGRADLDSGFDTIGCQWPGALEVPLFEHPLLHIRVAPSKVVKRFHAWLRAVHGEGQVVVLEVQSDTRKIDDGLHANGTELLGIT